MKQLYCTDFSSAARVMHVGLMQRQNMGMLAEAPLTSIRPEHRTRLMKLFSLGSDVAYGALFSWALHFRDHEMTPRIQETITAATAPALKGGGAVTMHIRHYALLSPPARKSTTIVPTGSVNETACLTKYLLPKSTIFLVTDRDATRRRIFEICADQGCDVKALKFVERTKNIHEKDHGEHPGEYALYDLEFAMQAIPLSSNGFIGDPRSSFGDLIFEYGSYVAFKRQQRAPRYAITLALSKDGIFTCSNGPAGCSRSAATGKHPWRREWRCSSSVS